MCLANLAPTKTNDIHGSRSACRLVIGLLVLGMLRVAVADEKRASDSTSGSGEKQVASHEGVTVLCVDQGGKPVAGAEVHVFQCVTGEPARYKQFGPFVSNEQGQATCPRAVLRDGGERFDRWAYARVPGRLVGVARSANWKGQLPSNPEFRLKMQPSRSVEGTVTVPEGVRVDEVTVHVHVLQVKTGPDFLDFQSLPRHLPFAGLDTALLDIFERRPDAQGRVRFDDVPTQGSLFLVTTGEGLAEAQWRNENNVFNEPIALNVAREGRLTGRVEAPDGKPAARMQLSARLSFSPEHRTYHLSTFRAVSDDDGRFSFKGLPAIPFVLSVEDPSHQWTVRPRERLSVASGETKEVDVSLEMGIDISGRVFDPAGQPVEKAAISALADTQEGPGLAHDMTDHDGRYRLRVPSGRAKLYFNALPSGFVYPDPQIIKRLDVVAGQDAIQDLDFTIYHNAREAQPARKEEKEPESPAVDRREKADPAVAARVEKIAKAHAERERQFYAELEVAKQDGQKVRDANRRYFADQREQAEEMKQIIGDNATDPAAFQAVVVLVGQMGHPLDDSLTSIVLDHHLADAGVGRLCYALRSRGGEDWAERILKAAAASHPQREVRGQAIFSLGDYYRGEAFPYRQEVPEAKKDALLVSATRYYQQALDEFADIPTPDAKTTLGEKAKHELTRLKNLPDLKVGRPAPPIAAEALDGKPLSLADYRGRVVLLVFWGSWCGPCMRMVPHERELAERYRDKPFTVLGVNCGDTRETAQATIETHRMTWRSWWDGEDTRGPIETDYDVPHWPRVFVIDAQGIIRAIDAEADELDRTIETLLNGLAKPE